MVRQMFVFVFFILFLPHVYSFHLMEAISYNSLSDNKTSQYKQNHTNELDNDLRMSPYGLYLKKNADFSSLLNVAMSHSSAKRGFKKRVMTATFKINTLLIAGVISPTFEYRLSEHFSIQANALGILSPNGFFFTDRPFLMLAGFVESRYYPKETFRGFFVGINTGAGLFNMSHGIIPMYWAQEDNGVMHRGLLVVGGGSLGWTFPVGDTFTLEPFMSAGLINLQWTNYVDKIQVSDTKKSRIQVFAYNGGINIGYKFLKRSVDFKIK